MSKTSSELQLTRRNFVKGSFAAAAAAATAGALYSCAPADEGEEGAGAESMGGAGEETIAWSQCNVNCGGNCIFQWHAKDGKVAYMETDNIGDDSFQSRACLRGRSMRRWLNSSERLLYPMKRVGKRGEGKFEQISWDEAIQTIAEKLQYTIDTYGNDAIYNIYATGMYSTTGNPSKRFLNAIGGAMNRHYDYSANQMLAAGPYMFGTQFSPYDAVHASSMTEAENNSDLIVMFGNSPAETRMGGANIVWDFARAREAVEARGGKVISIDYRLNESSSGHSGEWLPIRPGTDAALVAALIHEFIADDKVDTEWLHAHCVGWDEETMPESAAGQNKSYYDYVMGTGYDKVEKTPEWASLITGIPADKIRSLASDLENASAPYVTQGWGVQRHSNGESACMSICLIPMALGQMGKPGTNTGLREAEPSTYLVDSYPQADTDADGNPVEGGVAPNPVTWTIPCYEWLNAVDHGIEMNAINAGVKDPNGELDDGQLKNDIHFIWNYAGNCITNQHGGINTVHEVLSDDSRDLFILVWDTVMTDSAKYADILLPDAMRSEQLNMQTQGYGEYYTGVTVGGPAQEAPGECRCSYDVCADIAEAMGVRDAFTAGRTHDEWVQYLYEAGAEADGQMPTWDEILEQGVYKREENPVIGLQSFCDDPAANPLGTPSGKLEIYSEQLAELDDTWEKEEGESIPAIPLFYPGYYGYGSVTEEYPLYCTGFHHKSRTHSSFGFIREIEQVARQVMWINPIDAEARGISHGDTCSVKSPDGEIRIEALVTSRIMPGVISVPQGSWHKADMYGDMVDEGGCVNTLTAYRPNALSRGNGPSNSIVVQVAKA